MKAVNTYPSTIRFIPENLLTQEMCNKAVNKCFFVFDSIHYQYKTQEMCSSIIFEDSFSISYAPDQYKTQQVCDKVVDDCLAALNFVPDWFVTYKMIKKLFTALYTDKKMIYFNKDSGNAVLFCNEMGILNIDLNNINLDDTNYEKDDPDTIILIRLLARHIKF